MDRRFREENVHSIFDWEIMPKAKHEIRIIRLKIFRRVMLVRPARPIA